MKVVRKLTYEVPDDPDPRESEGTFTDIQTGRQRMAAQLMKSLPCGTYHWLTKVTVEHLEGPQWDTDGAESNSLRAHRDPPGA